MPTGWKSRPTATKAWRQWSALRIAGIYAAVSGAWVFGSDTALHTLVPSIERLSAYSMDKGLAFVAITSLLLHGLVRQAVKADTAAQTRLQDSEERYRTLVQNSPVGIFHYGADLRITYCNNRFAEILTAPKDAVLSLDLHRLQDTSLTPVLHAALQGTTEAFEGRYRTTLSGKDVWVSMVCAPVRDTGGEVTGAVGIVQDISDRKEAEARLEFSANHDALTGLPNRLLATDRLARAMAYAERAGTQVGLALLDLDNFKAVNDALGHSGGDELLKAVAARLVDCVRETDTVSRHGGDEFLLVLTDVRDGEACAEIALKILDRLSEPIEIDGRELPTLGSIGISVWPSDGADFDTLLRKADIAMYDAKRAGRNTYRFFDAKMNVDAEESLKLRAGLARALSRTEFVLHYQPQLELATDRIVGAEALIRWNHPERGLLPPAAFIPVAETSGLVVALGSWVIHEACRQAAAWQRAGHPPMVVGVNLSAAQFRRNDLVETVKTALDSSGLDPSLLELELTETMLIHDAEAVLQTIRRLKALGVKLSIDDFGTGYSSLSYLRRLDVERLKIDKSFVQDILCEANGEAIVRGIINLARSLGLRTIAEGVENEATLQWLRQHGCDEVQGYFLARPMPVDRLGRFLAERGQGHS